MLNLGEINTFVLKRSTIFQYEACSDKINAESYFKTFQLPDTLFSFFLVVQLHVWMCQARSMQEKSPFGRKMRNEILARMWTDFEYRVTKMSVTSDKKRELFQDLLYHHQAAILSYDSGNRDDKTLASALWRTLFTKHEVDPITIELAVRYVRHQMAHIRSIDSHHWCTSGRFDWAPFPPLETKHGPTRPSSG